MSIENFHKSTSRELISIKDRIRELVNHWGEDGRYKEVILKSMLDRMLPSRYEAVTGFVVKKDVADPNNHFASKQIDIIIVDNSFPFVFRSGDFGIVTPDAVVAIIEVKTNLEKAGISGVITKAHENGAFIVDGKNYKQKVLFNGIFSYEGFQKIEIKKFENQFKDASIKALQNDYFQYFTVNHISFNEKSFFKYWEQEYADITKETCYLYEIPDLSYSFFIGSLMDHLASESIKENSTLWFPLGNNFKVVNKFRI
jgi:hypothetical protein